MKYLCLTFNDEKALGAMPRHEVDAVINRHLDYDDELRSTGHLLAAEAVEPAEAATLLRVRNGRLSTSDGSSTRGREQLSGFYLIEARDLNEAIRIASRMPEAGLGLVEVRPVAELTRR